jgi:hypothetical protein
MWPVSNPERHVARRDDGVALRDQLGDRVVGDLDRADERLEVAKDAVTPGVLAGPRDHRIQMAREAHVVGEVFEDEVDVSAAEGLEDVADARGVLGLDGRHRVLLCVVESSVS